MVFYIFFFLDLYIYVSYFLFFSFFIIFLIKIVVEPNTSKVKFWIVDIKKHIVHLRGEESP